MAANDYYELKKVTGGNKPGAETQTPFAIYGYPQNLYYHGEDFDRSDSGSDLFNWGARAEEVDGASNGWCAVWDCVFRAPTGVPIESAQFNIIHQTSFLYSIGQHARLFFYDWIGDDWDTIWTEPFGQLANPESGNFWGESYWRSPVFVTGDASDPKYYYEDNEGAFTYYRFRFGLYGGRSFTGDKLGLVINKAWLSVKLEDLPYDPVKLLTTVDSLVTTHIGVNETGFILKDRIDNL